MDAKYGELGLGVLVASSVKNRCKDLSVKVGTPLLSDGKETVERYTPMETSTDELIAKLTNISMSLALELRFKEASVIMEAVGALHTLPNIAETIRDSWHPSLNTSGPSKGITYLSTVQMVDPEHWDVIGE